MKNRELEIKWKDAVAAYVEVTDRTLAWKE
jgi:hypothetical protein